jgi:hypothetical protein
MSDDHRDDDSVDDPVDAPQPNDQATTGRRSEPWSPRASSDEPSAACIAAAAHVANCPRCLAALRAHVDDTIATLLGGTTH